MGEPGGVDLHGGDVAEDVLIELRKLGDLQAQVQAPRGELIEHGEPRDGGTQHEEVDALAHDDRAQLAERSEDRHARVRLAARADHPD